MLKMEVGTVMTIQCKLRNLSDVLCTDHQFADIIGRDSPAEVEYHLPPSRNPQSKKVHIVGATKPPQPQRSQTEVTRNRKQQSDAARGGNRPVWNSNVRRQTAPVTQSGRDPAYEQRREQRLERQRELLAQVAANERHVPRRFISRERNQQNAATDELEMPRPEPSRQRRRTSPHNNPARGHTLSLVCFYPTYLSSLLQIL